MYQCLKPRPVVSLGKFDGKHQLKFLSDYRMLVRGENLLNLRQRYGFDNVFLIPCGQCESCRKNKAKEWAIRCSCEAKMHPFNYFLTLTFDDDHIQYACKEDSNKFLDNLSGHDHINKFKFFGCAEYGELTHRYHFHLVLFCDFELDLYDATRINGYYYYHSKKIDKLWTKGLYNIAPFEHNCARYVAKYSSKDGSKLFMSRNIGKSYVVAHAEELIRDDFKIYDDFGDKFFQDLPIVMLKWLNSFKADLNVIERKEIAHLITAQRMREIGSIHEEVKIHTDINKLNENSIRRRVI